MNSISINQALPKKASAKPQRRNSPKSRTSASQLGSSSSASQRASAVSDEWSSTMPVPRQTPETASSPSNLPSYERQATNALTLYLRDAAEVPLLTIEEENELAARIRNGDMAAREHMIRANLRLVVKIARDYDGLGLPLLDLINEGNIGLMKAVERFDPAKGGKLSTYGAWWIKQSIKRALANQSKTIRLPVHLVDKISKMKRASMELQKLLGREPSDEELADELEVSTRKVHLWQRSSMKTASLDQPVGEDASSQLSEVVADDRQADPYRALEETSTHAMVRHFLHVLDARELKIIEHRFGLEGGPQRTLDQIGQLFGVTRERIRQLQNQALSKLRHHIEELETVRNKDSDESDPAIFPNFMP
jgi:RNA polymerase primary sigma factor